MSEWVSWQSFEHVFFVVWVTFSYSVTATVMIQRIAEWKWKKWPRDHNVKWKLLLELADIWDETNRDSGFKQENQSKVLVWLCWKGCRQPSTHWHGPTTDPNGDSWPFPVNQMKRKSDKKIASKSCGVPLMISLFARIQDSNCCCTCTPMVCS